MKLFSLKLTAAVAIEGVIHKAGAIVHLAENEAKDLLHRGKALLHAVEQRAEEDLGLAAKSPAPTPAAEPAAPAAPAADPAPAVEEAPTAPTAPAKARS